MLVDVDSSAPTNVGVAVWDTPRELNSIAPPAAYCDWSGIPPIEHVGTVVPVATPAAGVTLTVFDTSDNESGPTSFGFVFSANDCPR